MTGCSVQCVKNSVQENEAVFQSAFQGSGISQLSDCLVIVKLHIFDISLIMQCHISWFLEFRQTTGLSLSLGAVVGSASPLLFLFFLFSFAPFCRIVQTLLRPSGIEKL